LLPHVIALPGLDPGIDWLMTAAKNDALCSSTAVRSKINVNPFDNRIALPTIRATAGGRAGIISTISEAP
jgi:hypothetical protein